MREGEGVRGVEEKVLAGGAAGSVWDMSWRAVVVYCGQEWVQEGLHGACGGFWLRCAGCGVKVAGRGILRFSAGRVEECRRCVGAQEVQEGVLVGLLVLAGYVVRVGVAGDAVDDVGAT